MDRKGLAEVLDALRAADEDISGYYEAAAGQSDDDALRMVLQRLARGHRADAAEMADERRRLESRALAGTGARHVGWGTSGYGTGDQYGGGQGGGAGGFPSAGPSYSGGEQDLNTGE